MNEEKLFSPTNEHVQFAREIVRVTAHGGIWIQPTNREEIVRVAVLGGVWIQPTNRAEYRFDQQLKTLTLVRPTFNALTDRQRENHERTRTVFHSIGWRVLP